jgi:hypothetical protein
MAKSTPYLTKNAFASLLASGIAVANAAASAAGDAINDPSAGGLTDFTFLRVVRTKTATAGYTTAEVEVEGSPFTGYLQIKATPAVKRDEAAVGAATLDYSLTVWLVDPTLDIRVNDICILPQEAIKASILDGGITEFVAVDENDVRSKVIRARLNAGQIECNLELGTV